MEKKIKDEVIYITGASAGIGFTTAQESLKNGATVVITGRDKAKLDAAENELKKVSNKVLSHNLDVSNELSLIHISEPRDQRGSRMPSSA